jgi:importin subunit beta-1
MTLLLNLIQSSGRQSPVLEDAFLCVGAMASALEGEFQPYVEAFLPALSNALNAHEEYTLCSIGVGLIGDICRALGERSQPYAQGFMEALMTNLRSAVLHRSVKPPILSCFGDIALAVGPDAFEPFLEATMSVLAQAGAMRADPNNYDIVEYVNVLREGILESYTGVVSAFKQTPRCEFQAMTLVIFRLGC